MPKQRELNIENRIRIQSLHQEGKTQVETARLFKCSRCAVQSEIQRFAETGSHANKMRTGRKRGSTDHQDRKLVRDSLWDRKKPLLSSLQLYRRILGS